MRILVVEDEHRIANTIKKGLEQERYAVDLAYRGDDGLDMALTEEYDLILLDVMLPGIDGVTVCRSLRKKKIHTPVLMLTAKAQVGDKVSGLDAGADDYVSKPFSFEELLARMRALIRRPKAAVTERLRVGELVMDTLTFEVWRDGVAVQLTNKEFAFLEYLMRNSNTILTKEQIIGHVWNYNADILPNTVEVYIRNLRNKVDKPFADKPALVQTVRGFGYKIGE